MSGVRSAVGLAPGIGSAILDDPERFRELFELAGVGVVIADPATSRFLRVNAAYCALTGYSEQELLQLTIRDVTHPVDTHAFIQMASGEITSYDSVKRYLRPDGEVVWAHINAMPLPGDEHGGLRLAAVVHDITAQKRAEEELRERDERHAFLLALSDATRSEGDPVRIQAEASRLLGRALRVNRVVYGDIVDSEAVVALDYTDGVASLVGRYPLDVWGAAHVSAWRRGEVTVYADVRADPTLSEAERASWLAIEVAAYIGVTLVKDGRFVAAFTVHSATPRAWATSEVELVREVAERTWAAVERARAEQALREAQERQAFLLQLSDAMRGEAAPTAIQEIAARLLGQHLASNRASYAEIVGDEAIVMTDWTNGVPSTVGRHRLDTWGESHLAAWRRGGVIVSRDVLANESLSDAERALWRASQVAAYIAVMVMRADQWVASFGVSSATPRTWTSAEVSLVWDVAERTRVEIDRARAQIAERESETKYRSLFTALSQGLAMCELVRDDFGRGVDFRYLEFNPALEAQTGLAESAVRGRLASEVFPTDYHWWVDTFADAVDRGVQARFEHELPAVDRWLDISVVPNGGNRFAVLFEDVTARRRADQALRASDTRHAFLVELNDALRPLRDPEAIQHEATRLLGVHLGASRVGYAEDTGDGQTVLITRNFTQGVLGIEGRYRYVDFGPTLQELRAGRTVVRVDVANDPTLSDREKRAHAALQLGATMDVPLAKDGRLTAILFVHARRPRAWTPEEAALAEAVAERTWAAVERARVEAALRASEAILKAALQRTSGFSA